MIIEYPTLHVVLKESSHDMEVLHQGKRKFVPVMLRITLVNLSDYMTVFISLYICFPPVFTYLTEFALQLAIVNVKNQMNELLILSCLRAHNLQYQFKMNKFEWLQNDILCLFGVLHVFCLF